MAALLGSPGGGASDLARAQAGDPDAIDAVLREHHDAITAVCRRRLRSRADAEDAIQETMVRALGALDRVDDERRLRSYLCRIAERVCIDMMRAGARPMPVTVDTVTPNEPELAALRREEASLLSKTLEALNDRDAEALWMRDAMETPIPEVAAHLGVTEGSARVLLTRARKRAREGWERTLAGVPAIGLPAAGLKLPAPLAKLVSTIGLGPAVAAPAAVVAVALALTPTFFSPAMDVPDAARPGLAIERSVDDETADPLVQGLPTASTAITPAGPSGIGSGATAAPAAPDTEPRPAGEARVDGPGADVVIDRTPRDENVSAGDEDVLGLEAGLGQAMEALGIDTPEADLTMDNLLDWPDGPGRP